MNLHGQWSLQVLVLVIGALIFPAWMGCGWLALKLWKAHKVFGFWTFRAKLEPRDLWVGLYRDASRSLIALYVCIILETQDAVDIALDYQGPRRTPGECAPPLPLSDDSERPDGATEGRE